MEDELKTTLQIESDIKFQMYLNTLGRYWEKYLLDPVCIELLYETWKSSQKQCLSDLRFLIEQSIRRIEPQE